MRRRFKLIAHGGEVAAVTVITDEKGNILKYEEGDAPTSMRIRGKGSVLEVMGAFVGYAEENYKDYQIKSQKR